MFRRAASVSCGRALVDRRRRGGPRHVEPIDYVRALVRRWPIIAIGALIGAAIAFLGTDPKPAPVRRTFTATHTLLATDQSQFNANAPIGTITFAQVPVFATTGEVPRRVAQQLNWPGAPAALATQVAVKGDPTTGTITFTVTKDDPAEAVTIADAFADQTVKYLAEAQDNQRQNRQQKLLGQANELESELRDLDGKVNAEAAQLAASGQATQDVDSVLRAQRDTVARQYSSAFEAYRDLVAESEQDLNVTTLERAQPVQVQTGGLSAPRTRSTRVPIAAAIGAVLGALVALVAERLDARLRDRRRAEEAFGASVVAELPTLSRRQRASQPIVRPDQHSAAAEAFRSLRTSITFMAAGWAAARRRRPRRRGPDHVAEPRRREDDGGRQPRRRLCRDWTERRGRQRRLPPSLGRRHPDFRRPADAPGWHRRY